MKTLIGNGMLILALVAAGATRAAEAEAVVNATKRQEVLNRAKSLLSTPSPAVVGRDPFSSEGIVSIEDPGNKPEIVQNSVKQDRPLNTRELLQAIATSAKGKPSGYFVMSGQPTLVFGPKRVKVGGLITIPFDGKDYSLEIVSIVPPNFTLRLDREEFTRPIK